MVIVENSTWVRQHAQDYILAYFGVLTSRRKSLHQDHIHRITDRAWHYYGAPPHPSEIAAADQELKRGIDEDWKSSVQKYPEVLEYFYGLVDLSLPSDDDPGVRDPPLSALGGGKRAPRVRGSSRGRRRRSVVEEDGREMGGGGRREGRRGGGGRPGVQFAPMPSGYGYVNPPGYP